MYETIIKGFNQSLSKEELTQIETWKSESDANLKTLNELTALHKASKDLKGYEPFDKEAAWTKIADKTNLTDDAKQFRLPNWLKGLAAIFVLVIASFFLLKGQMEEHKTYKTYSTANVFQSIQLIDGTEVILDKTSELKVIDSRYVNLKGRAKFHVTTTSDKENFTVKFNGGKVTVLGTQFTILATDDLLEVSVTEGHVRLDYEGRSMDLYTNDIVRLSDTQLAVTKDNYANTDSWTSNELIFKDEPITKVLSDISKHFKQKVILDKSIKNIDGCILTTKFENPSLDSVLKEIKTIFNAEIIKKDNEYVVVSIKC